MITILHVMYMHWAHAIDVEYIESEKIVIMLNPDPASMSAWILCV